MVWVYTEYAGYPYLSDEVNKKFRFGVESCVSSTNIRTEDVDTPTGKAVSIRVIDPNAPLNANFYYRTDREGKPYQNLQLTEQGLLTRQRVFVKGQTSEGMTSLKVRNLGVADFDDLKDIATYAVSRLQAIKSEVVQDPRDLTKDIDDKVIEEALKYRDLCLATSWETTQAEICRLFYGLFAVSTYSEIRDGHMVDRTNIDERQRKGLLDILEPIKPEGKWR